MTTFFFVNSLSSWTNRNKNNNDSRVYNFKIVILFRIKRSINEYIYIYRERARYSE